jgi:hypothetical protein
MQQSPLVLAQLTNHNEAGSEQKYKEFQIIGKYSCPVISEECSSLAQIKNSEGSQNDCIASYMGWLS